MPKMVKKRDFLWEKGIIFFEAMISAKQFSEGLCIAGIVFGRIRRKNTEKRTEKEKRDKEDRGIKRKNRRTKKQWPERVVTVFSKYKVGGN